MGTRENILVIRLKSIGDILFTLPAVHAVRKNFPEARLHFLVAKEFAPLLRGFTGVDEIIPFDRTAFHSPNLATICLSAIKLVHRLRQKKFSLVVDFQGYGETAWLAWLSGAPERWGGVYWPARLWAFTRGEWRYSQILHPAEWNLALLQKCGLHLGEIRNEYVVPEDALAEARKFFVTNNLDENRPKLFLQPFTSTPHKNWPLENFIALARHFQSRGAQIIFGGGPAERDALKSADDAGFIVSAGAPLLVTAGMMKLSSLVAGADTGLLHLAVALDKRVVMLMSSITPGRPHPFRHADWTVTPPPGRKVSEISVAEVIAACERTMR